MKKSPVSPSLKDKCARAREVYEAIERLSSERKKFYEEHDALARELRDVPGLEAHGIRVARTFAKGNTQWGHGPVRELSIELVEETLAQAATRTAPKRAKA